MTSIKDSSPAADSLRRQIRQDDVQELLKTTADIDDLSTSLASLVKRVSEEEVNDKLSKFKKAKLLANYRTIAKLIEDRILQCLVREQAFPEDINPSAACSLLSVC